MKKMTSNSRNSVLPIINASLFVLAVLRAIKSFRRMANGIQRGNLWYPCGQVGKGFCNEPDKKGSIPKWIASRETYRCEAN